MAAALARGYTNNRVFRRCKESAELVMIW